MAVKISYEKNGVKFEGDGLNKTIRELGYNGPNKNSKDCIRWMESIGCTNIEVDGSEYQASEKKPSVKNMSPLEVIVKQYIKYNDASFEKTKKEKLEALKVKRESTIEKMVSALDMVAFKNVKNELLGINFEIEEVKASAFETSAESVIKWIKDLFNEFEEEQKQLAIAQAQAQEQQAQAQAQEQQAQAQAQEQQAQEQQAQATPQEKEEK